MNISYNELKNKEVINLNDGSKMGHIIDFVFDCDDNKILGFVVPGEKKMFHKNNDLFIPIEKIRRIGDDVILIRFEVFQNYSQGYYFNGKDIKNKNFINGKFQDNKVSYIRFKPLDNKKYK